MLDKLKVFFSILIILMVIFGIGYSIVRSIQISNEKISLITSDSIDEYMVEANRVTNYSTYYYLSDCLNNIAEACEQNKYEELYELYIEDYLSQCTKEEIVTRLKSIKWNLHVMDKPVGYKLEKIYKVNEEYILCIKMEDTYLYLVLKDVSLQKTGSAYEWAFVKQGGIEC